MRVVSSRVLGLDSPVTPPPLTSSTGFRSRIMASLMFFLTRRQADRTILMFGICVFMFKRPPQLFCSQRFSDESRREQAEKLLIACMTDARKLLTTLFVLGEGKWAGGNDVASEQSCYNTSDLNSPSLTRVRIFIFGRTAAIVRMICPRSFVVML